MADEIAFYCRARPQNADALDVFLAAKRVFIGYPLPRPETEYDPHELAGCFVHPLDSYDVWENARSEHGVWKRSLAQNRNMVDTVGLGSIVLVPRPQLGVVFAGRIDGPFVIENDPPWAEDYLVLRARQGLTTDDAHEWHIADVMQGWPVDEFRPIPMSLLPGWIRTSLFGRSTFGRLKNHPLDDRTTAFQVLDELLSGNARHNLNWTTDIVEIKQRLVDELNPTTFEHLIVSLMQLARPEEDWHHIGGSGDGGVDGIGFGGGGEVSGVVQCKLHSSHVPSFQGTTCPAPGLTQPKRFAAVLTPENPTRQDDDTRLLDLDWIAKSVSRYARHLPLALTLRIGRPWAAL